MAPIRLSVLVVLDYADNLRTLGNATEHCRRPIFQDSVVRTSTIFVTSLPFTFKISLASVRWRRERTYPRDYLLSMLTKLEISFGFRHELKSNQFRRNPYELSAINFGSSC